MPEEQFPRYAHGAFIRARREALGLNQSQLAQAARLTPAMICRVEAGDRRGRPLVLRAVAEALEIPAAELLGLAGYHEDARHWGAVEAAQQRPDPLLQFQQALAVTPVQPSVPIALLTVAVALAEDSAFQARFDQAVANYLGASETDRERFAALRALLIEG